MAASLFAIATLAISPTVCAQTGTEATLTTADVKALTSGETIARAWHDKARSDKAYSIFAAIDVNAPPQAVWAIMTDCAMNVKIVKNMKNCTVIERSKTGRWDIREQISGGGFMKPKVRSVFRSEYQPYSRITISRAGGDMKVQNGVWRLAPLKGGKTRLTYHAHSRSPINVPASMLRGAAQKNMPKILMNLRQAAEDKYSAHSTVKR